MNRPTTPWWRRQLRLGLAARLALGFALIAIVLLLGYDAARRDLDSAAATLLQTQATQVRLSRVADDLTYQVAAFDRVVLAEIRNPDPAGRDAVTGAEQSLLATLDTYARLEGGNAGEIDALRDEVRQHIRLGWSLIDLVAQRQVALNGIRDALDRLTRRISTAFSQSVQLPDPMPAGRAYADLEIALGRLRTAFNNYLVAAPAERDTTLQSATAGLRQPLGRHQERLRRAPGRAWLDLVEEDIGDAERLDLEVRDLDTVAAVLRRRFIESGQQLPPKLDAALATPASHAVAESARSAVDATRSAQHAIRQLTWVVLGLTLLVSLLTVVAVLRPVRRLTDATRALAGGGREVRVPSGGPRELGELGEAFNHMAEQLAAADDEVSRYQRELEDRVRARTRRLAYLANHDPLSGLPNRRYAFNHLRRVVRAAARRDGGVGLIALDIDNFKAVNDSFGHILGDELLRAVAARLRLVAGGDCFIARLGGDEFIVALDDADLPGMPADLAERIVNGFRAPLNLDGRDVLVSVSVGVARFPEHAEDAPGLALAADAALYRAKALGRNRIATFSHALLQGTQERFLTEQSLRRAIAGGELELAFQPQVSLADGSADVVEALLRWRRDDGSMVPAGEFIAIAEQSGLIIELGEWALRTAASAVAGWRSQGIGPTRVAVNVSPHQLLDSRFVDRLAGLLTQHRLPADAIELELTETAFQTSAATIESLRRMRDGGIDLALDDFGAGYSSLNSLSRLPIHRVKIDRSLVVDAPHSRRAESLVRSIIAVCHNLGLAVTIEGIEHAEQLAWLASCGPVHVQGYLLARPMQAAAVPDFTRHSAGRVRELLAAASLPAVARHKGDSVVPFRHGPDARDT